MSRIGALATLSVRYYDLGVKAAEMAYNILVNGTKPAELPIAFVSDGVTPKYNAEIARALGHHSSCRYGSAGGNDGITFPFAEDERLYRRNSFLDTFNRKKFDLLLTIKTGML